MSDLKRTQFAMQAMSLAETFNLLLGDERVEGPVSYKVELSAPEGMSTAGGKQATQHVKLVPEGGGTTIVAGSANQAESWAELRTFEQLKQLHAQRFKGADIPLNRVQYNDLVAKLKAFFVDKGCTVRTAQLAAPTPSPVTAAAQTGRSGSLILVLILVAALASAAGVTWFLTHR